MFLIKYILWKDHRKDKGGTVESSYLTPWWSRQAAEQDFSGFICSYVFIFEPYTCFTLKEKLN